MLDKLVAYAEKGYNVLIEGPHGVGKTALVKAAFNKVYGEGNYVILVGSTTDPFLDVIGLPYASDTDDGKKKLDYLRPQIWGKNIRAVFVDEYNRTKPTVRNALLELSQTKHVNGIETSVETVWAAINPDDHLDETGRPLYNVEPIDPAQKDRFHIHLKMLPELDTQFFQTMFGKEMTTCALEYWGSLDEKLRVKYGLSPRRMEYALKAYNDGFDLADVIPAQLEPGQLSAKLDTIAVYTMFTAAVKAGNNDAVRKLVNGPKSNSLINIITDNADLQIVVDNMTLDRYVAAVGVNQKFLGVVPSDLDSARAAMRSAKDTELSDKWKTLYDRDVALVPNFVEELSKGLSSKLYKNMLKPGLSQETVVSCIALCSSLTVKTDSEFVQMFKFIHNLGASQDEYTVLRTCPRTRGEMTKMLSVLTGYYVRNKDRVADLQKSVGDAYLGSKLWASLHKKS